MTSEPRLKRRRFERLKRTNRYLREQIVHYRKMTVALALVAALLIGGLLYLSLDAPEPIPLGAGKAGVKGLDTTTVAAPAVPPAPEAAPAPPTERGRHAGEGEASYYGEELAGNHTASGERFDPGKLTAAHRTLPLGTRLRVTNTRNGQSVIVRVNDRGPFAKRRVLDVSKAAARRLGMLARGTAPVRIELLPS